MQYRAQEIDPYVTGNENAHKSVGLLFVKYSATQVITNTFDILIF
jgi:hypothetical protein